MPRTRSCSCGTYWHGREWTCQLVFSTICSLSCGPEMQPRSGPGKHEKVFHHDGSNRLVATSRRVMVNYYDEVLAAN